METPSNPKPIEHRIREGLARVATVLRAEDWRRAQSMGLNPTQLAILERLASRNLGLSVNEIALELSVSQPTTTDSVKSLVAKGLVEKHSDPDDRRAVRIVLTEAGELATQRNSTGGEAHTMVARLAPATQEQLLLTLVDVIRGLQQADAIPVQRMCVNCRHFRPFAHPTGPAPHHCNFVDAAFGQADLRIECREYETADPSLQAATWDEFKDHPNLQAS